MHTQPEAYPVISIIFTLLNAIRRGIARPNIWREFRRQRVRFKPRLVFWIALCKEAGLVRVRDNHELQVSNSARAWLNKSPEEQTFALIAAWQKAPRNSRVRQFRKKLLWKLKYDQSLTSKDQVAAQGLEALGLVVNGKLT